MRTLDALMADSPVFRGLADEHLELIAGCASNTGFDTGETAFHEGEPADVFYLVRRGRIELTMYVPNRGDTTIQTVGPGEVVGWSWLVPPFRWHFGGRAVEDVRAEQFDAACLREKCEQDAVLGAELMSRFAQVLVERLEAAQLQLTEVFGGAVAPAAPASTGRSRP